MLCITPSLTTALTPLVKYLVSIPPDFNADIIIQNCIFKTDNQEVSDVSWHFNSNADYKFTIINNYFSHHFSLDSNVTFGEVLFINNSYKNDNVFANANVTQFNNIKRE